MDFNIRSRNLNLQYDSHKVLEKNTYLNEDIYNEINSSCFFNLLISK